MAQAYRNACLWTAPRRPPIIARMDLKAAWYDAIPERMSRRRFDGRPLAAELREQLEVFCDGASAPAGAPGSAAGKPGAVPAPARVCLVDDSAQTLFTGLVGSYGKVAGTPLAAAFVGRSRGKAETAPEDVQAAAGYIGEAFILEATRLGVGTCWIAGSFDHVTATRLAELAPGEQVVAVTPLGYPTDQQTGGERLLRTMVKASARLSVEKLAPGILGGGWPRWAVSAVQAARLAPSGANRQPCRFRMDGDALVVSRAEKLYWTAPIDVGIVRLHVELGAMHEGVTGSWTQLPEPDVAKFTPAD
jgi:nitroreductase